MTREEMIKLAEEKLERASLIRAAEAKFKSPKVENIIQEQHPDVSAWDRFVLKNLDSSPEQSAKYFEDKGLETKATEDQTLVRRKGEKQWRVIDPDTGFFSSDILGDIGDIAGMIPEGIAQAATTVGGAGIGALLGGAGVIPGAIAGSAAGAGGINALKQGIRQSIGIQEDFNPGEALTLSALGAITTPIGGGAGKYASKIASPLFRSIADRGLVGSAWKGITDKVMPKIAEVSSGGTIPARVFKYFSKNPEKMKQIKNDPLSFADKSANRTLENIDKESRKYSKLLSDAVDNNTPYDNLDFFKKNPESVIKFSSDPAKVGGDLVSSFEEGIKKNKDLLRPVYDAISSSDVPINISGAHSDIKSILLDQKNVMNKVKGNKAVSRAYSQLKKIYDDVLTKNGAPQTVQTTDYVKSSILDQFGNQIMKPVVKTSTSVPKNQPIGVTSLDVAYSLKRALGDIIEAQNDSSVGALSKKAIAKTKSKLDDAINSVVGQNDEWKKINEAWSKIMQQQDDLDSIIGSGTNFSKAKKMVNALDTMDKDPMLKRRLLDIANEHGIDLDHIQKAKSTYENLGRPDINNISDFLVETHGKTTKEAMEDYDLFVKNYRNRSNITKKIKSDQPDIQAENMINVFRDAAKKGNLADYPEDIMEDALAFQSYELLDNPPLVPSLQARVLGNILSRTAVGAGIGGAVGGKEGAAYGAGMGALLSSPASMKFLLKHAQGISNTAKKAKVQAGIRAMLPTIYNNRGE